jgi:hypothetical protein
MTKQRHRRDSAVAILLLSTTASGFLAVPSTQPRCSPTWRCSLQRCAAAPYYRQTVAVSAINGEPAKVDSAEAAAIRQIMALPTIDIKLELQMRGVEHRDALEKQDLAARLAYARLSQQQRAGSTAQDAAVTAAVKLGDKALMRALSAMDVPFSRLADTETLARQYVVSKAAARRTAVPRGAEAAAVNSEVQRQRPRRQAVEQPDATSTSKLVQRLRKVGRTVSSWCTDEELARQWEEAHSAESGKRSRRTAAVRRRTDTRDQQQQQQQQYASIADNGDSEEYDSYDSYDEQPARAAAAPTDSVAAATQTHVNSAATDSSNSSTNSSEAVFRAAASSLSTRQLLSELDSMGVAYDVLAARSGLEEVYVRACMNLGQTASSKSSSSSSSKSSAYTATGQRRQQDAGGQLRASRSSSSSGSAAVVGSSESVDGTYAGALRWARRLTYEDLCEELKCRGVEVPQGSSSDFSHLARTLANAVMADERQLHAQSSSSNSSSDRAADLRRRRQQYDSGSRATAGTTAGGWGGAADIDDEHDSAYLDLPSRREQSESDDGYYHPARIVQDALGALFSGAETLLLGSDADATDDEQPGSSKQASRRRHSSSSNWLSSKRSAAAAAARAAVGSSANGAAVGVLRGAAGAGNNNSYSHSS